MALDKARYWQVIDGHRDLGKNYTAFTQLLYAPDCNFNAGTPVDACADTAAVTERFWQPLVNTFTIMHAASTF